MSKRDWNVDWAYIQKLQNKIGISAVSIPPSMFVDFGEYWLQQVRELEAQCVAMREALLNINELGNCDKCGQTYVLHDIADIKHKALSATAGLELLERMKKLEEDNKQLESFYKYERKRYVEMRKVNADLLKRLKYLEAVAGAAQDVIADFEASVAKYPSILALAKELAALEKEAGY